MAPNQTKTVKFAVSMITSGIVSGANFCLGFSDFILGEVDWVIHTQRRVFPPTEDHVL